MGGSSGSKGSPVFCLETACWLMEVAWQVGGQHRFDVFGRGFHITIYGLA